MVGVGLGVVVGADVVGLVVGAAVGVVGGGVVVVGAATDVVVVVVVVVGAVVGEGDSPRQEARANARRVRVIASFMAQAEAHSASRAFPGE